MSAPPTGGPQRRAGENADPESAISERVYVVDRISGGVAVLVPDDDTLPDEDVAVAALPPRLSEGAALRVPVHGSTPVWHEAAADPQLRAEREKAARRRLERLAKRDPGGDVVL